MAHSTCTSHRCLHWTEGELGVCPRCGRAMWPDSAWRRRGWVLVGVGLFILVFVLALLWFIVPLALKGPEGADGAAIATDDTGAMVLMFGLLGGLLAFGLAGMIAGWRQVRTGRRSAAMLKIVLWLFMAIMLGGTLGVLLLGGDAPRVGPGLRLP